MLGARETTRRTGIGMRTLRPVSSRIVRNSFFAGEALGVWSARKGATVGAAQNNNAAVTIRRSKVGTQVFKVRRLSGKPSRTFMYTAKNKNAPRAPWGKRTQL